MQNNTHTQKQNIHCCDWELIITRDKTLKKKKIKCRDVVVYDGSKLSVSGCEPCLCM